MRRIMRVAGAVAASSITALSFTTFVATSAGAASGPGELYVVEHDVYGGGGLYLSYVDPPEYAAPEPYLFGGLSAGAGGWSYERSRSVAGDINGDGLGDLLIPHAQPAGGLLLWAIIGTQSGWEEPRLIQDLRGGGWSFDASRQYLADVDGDGDDDLVSAHAQAGNPGLLLWVHTSHGTTFDAPLVWQDLRGGGWSYQASRQVLGDINGDARVDLVTSHAQAGNPGLLLWQHISTGSSFSTPEVQQDLRGGGWSYAASRQVAGDFDGDLVDEIVSIHDQYGGGILVWRHSVGGATVWQDLRSGGWSFPQSQQYAFDVGGDGLDDLVSVHSDAASLQYWIWHHPSSGTGFEQPVLWMSPPPSTWYYDWSRFAAVRL